MNSVVSVHAHEVLALLKESDIPYTMNDLTSEVVRNLGSNVVFHTCSQQDLSLSALMEFLLAKGKVVREGEFIKVNPKRICNH
ncbi:YecH family metal-binding protein [Thaumasiovibrio subtropicus]|uniref:YecH family metal-binding protein n=1 Tax=Thaumasiovibrio subtropicus TaxID=1891207 RepID=UPI00131CBAFE|nr:YecH family metal-binding protein [Thaumasiovibrio subtropicus]